MAEYTNFDLKKFIAENKNIEAKEVQKEELDITAEETVSEESGLASAAIEEFLAADSNGVTIAEFVKAMIDGAAAFLGDEAEYYDLDDASQSILKAVGRGDLIGEETVSELDGAGSVDALTALIGAGGLTGGAIALSKLMDSLEDGKLGEKGKAVAKFLRDAGKTFSGQGAPMKEEPTVELTREEAFKKEIKDLLDS
jgi:hypothetical protein